MSALPWWLLIFFQIISLWSAGISAGVFTPSSLTADPGICRVHLKVLQVQVLADMGDGLFDGKMEVQLFFVASNGTAFHPRLYPAGGSRKTVQGDTIRLEGYTFSLNAADEISLRVLAVEIDDLPRFAGVDMGQAVRFVGETARSSLWLIGGAVDTVIDFGADVLTGLFAADDIIADETIALWRSNHWNAGPPATHRSDDGNLDITYRVTYSGCDG
jgi:hypothetical protein